MKVTYLGHSFFKIAFNDAPIIVDPFVTNTCEDPGFKMLEKSPVKDSDLKGLAMILITHEHFDHFNKKTVENIALKHNATVVGHESVVGDLELPRNLVNPISLGKKLQLRNTLIEPVPAHHPNSFYPMGYKLESNGESVYHAGDTDLLDVFSDIETDLAILPIGGTYTMDVIDAVRTTKLMKPKAVMPMHYNTFEMIKADPIDFKQRIEKSLLKTKPYVPKPGETVKL